MENGSYDAILGAHHPSRLHTTRPGPSDHPDRPTMTAHSDASQKGPKGLNCSKKNHAPRTFPVPLRLWSAFAPQHPQKHPESFRSPAISHDPGSHRRHHPLECQPEGTQRTKLLQNNPCAKRIPPSPAPDLTHNFKRPSFLAIDHRNEIQFRLKNRKALIILYKGTKCA